MAKYFYSPSKMVTPRSPNYTRIGCVVAISVILTLCICISLNNLTPEKKNVTPVRTPTSIPTASSSPSSVPPTAVPTLTPTIPPSPTVVPRSEGPGKTTGRVPSRPTVVYVRPAVVPTVRVRSGSVQSNPRQPQLAPPIIPQPPALPQPVSDPDIVSGLEWLFRSIGDANLDKPYDCKGPKKVNQPSRNCP